MLELGVGFTFVARPKRLTIDNENYCIDLLFYHRKLRRLVALELKLDAFRAGDKGQMELHLRWLDAYEKEPGEEGPLGLILCAGKSEEHVELLLQLRVGRGDPRQLDGHLHLVLGDWKRGNIREAAR